MLHIFKDTVTGEAVTMPVTPGGYAFEHGRKVSVITMHTVGEVAQPAERVLLDKEQTYLLPSKAYPFNNPGAVLDPFHYIERFEKWSDAKRVLRFIISGTPINAPILLGPIKYERREDDLSGDLYMTVPMVGYRYLEAETTQIRQDTGNKGRGAEEQSAGGARTYVVVYGDTLSGICRKFYGDASLYPRLAAANHIANPNIISVGQVLTIPDLGSLPAAPTSVPRSVQTAQRTVVEVVRTDVHGRAQFRVSMK